MQKRLWLILIIFSALLTFVTAQAQDSTAPILNAPDRHFYSDPLDALALSPDGTIIATGDRDNLVRLWNTQTSEPIAVLAGHNAWVTRVAFSPDGGVIVSGSHDHTVRLWDANQYTLLQTFTHHTGSVTGVAFSPNGLLLASASLDGTIWIGDAVSGTTIATLTNYSGAVWGIAFSPDGRFLVSGSEDGTIWRWGLYDNTLAALHGHTGAVTALAFNADGTLMATSSWDRTLRLWDMTTNSQIMIYEGHQGPVTGVSFRLESLISSSLDATIRLWDIARGTQQGILQGEGSPLSGLAMSSNQTLVAAAGIYGVIEFWDVSSRIEELLVQPTIVPPTYTPLPLAPTAIPQTVNVDPTAQPENPPAEIEQPVQLRPSTGTSLSLPTVNIFAPITTFYLDGISWFIDPWEPNVGHLQGTAWIDVTGNIALGGHSEYPDGRPGIFNGLYGLNIGDPIILTADGVERRYVVIEKRTVQFDDLSVVYPTTDNRLTLITCDIPSYDPASNYYYERLVVIAVPG